MGNIGVKCLREGYCHQQNAVSAWSMPLSGERSDGRLADSVELSTRSFGCVTVVSDPLGKEHQRVRQNIRLTDAGAPAQFGETLEVFCPGFRDEK